MISFFPHSPGRKARARNQSQAIVFLEVSWFLSLSSFRALSQMLLPPSPLHAFPLLSTPTFTSLLSSSTPLTHCSSPLSPCLVLPALGLMVAGCPPIPGPPLQILDWCRVRRFGGLHAPPAPRLSRTIMSEQGQPEALCLQEPLFPPLGNPSCPTPNRKTLSCLCTHTSPVS